MSDNPFDSQFVPATDAEPEKAASVPKLSILDLMIWAGCVAGFLGLTQIGINEQNLPSEAYGLYIKFINGVYSLIWGTALAASISWLRNAATWNGSSTFSAGRVFLIFVACSSVLGICYRIIVQYLMVRLFTGSLQVFVIQNIVYYIISIVLILAVAFFLRRDRWVFALLPTCVIDLVGICTMVSFLLGTVPLSVTHVLQIAPVILSVVGALLAMVLIVVDLLEKPRKDWLHYVGVFCLLGTYFTAIGSSSWNLYFSWTQ